MYAVKVVLSSANKALKERSLTNSLYRVIFLILPRTVNAGLETSPPTIVVGRGSPC